MIVFATGTRQIITAPYEQRNACYQTAWTWLWHNQPELVISGMAEGWDTLVASAAIDLGIPFDAYVPNHGYGEYYWGRKSLMGVNRLHDFENILRKARQVVYSSQTHNTTGLYLDGVHMNFIRNHDMVDAGDMGITWAPGSRGTAECIRYAEKQGVPVEVLGG